MVGPPATHFNGGSTVSSISHITNPVEVTYQYLTSCSTAEVVHKTETEVAATAAACELLAAEACGFGERRFFAHETYSWWRVGRAAMISLGAAVLADHGIDAYSLWCADFDGAEEGAVA